MRPLPPENFDSRYYPPRARWYRRVFFPWFALRRALHLEKIHLPAGFSFQQFILSLLLPGYAFFAKGRRVLGWTFVGLYGCSVLFFVVALGYQLGAFAFGLMISVHASSIIFLEGYWLRDYCNFGIRLALAIVTLLAVWRAFYSPLTGFVEAHWIMPLIVRGNVVIVRSYDLHRHVKPGDWVLYSLRPRNMGDPHREGGAIWIQAGFGWGPVLAGEREQVNFSANAFTVNGVSHPLRAHMPTSGELVVPEKHWFVWPEFDINGRGYVSEANLTALMLQMATVSENEFIGKPFKHWFWRRQVLL